MVHDEKSVGLFMSSAGKHGRMHMEKYFKQGKPCPVVLCVGQDPLLLLAAGNGILPDTPLENIDAMLMVMALYK